MSQHRVNPFADVEPANDSGLDENLLHTAARASVVRPAVPKDVKARVSEESGFPSREARPRNSRQTHARRIPPGRGQKNIKGSLETLTRFDELCAQRKQAPEHVLEYLLDLHDRSVSGS